MPMPRSGVADDGGRPMDLSDKNFRGPMGVSGKPDSADAPSTHMMGSFWNQGLNKKGHCEAIASQT